MTKGMHAADVNGKELTYGELGAMTRIPGAKTIIEVDPRRMTAVMRKKIIASMQQGYVEGGYQSQAAQAWEALAQSIRCPFAAVSEHRANWYCMYLRPAILNAVNETETASKVAEKIAGSQFPHSTFKTARESVGDLHAYFYGVPMLRIIVLEILQANAKTKEYQSAIWPALRVFDEGVPFVIEYNRQETARPARKKELVTA
jgi:protoheme ferro-lyase